MLVTVEYLKHLEWRKHIKHFYQMMNSRAVREYLLLAVTFLSLISGLALAGMGLYIMQNLEHLIETRVDTAVKGSNLTRTLLARYGAIVPNKDYIPQHIDLGPWVTWLPARVFEMGVAIIAFSAFGMFVAKSRKPLLLYIMIVFLLTAIAGQLMFMLNLMDYRSQLHYSLRQKLSSFLHTRYEFGAETHDPFSFIMNGVMLMGECCGITGPQDFMTTKHNFQHTGNNEVAHNATLLFPLACCQRCYIERGFYTTLDCALSWSKKAINTRGCYKTAFTYLNDYFGKTILWTFMVISYVELMQILLCLSLARVLWREKARVRFSAIEITKKRNKRTIPHSTEIDV